MSDLQFESQGDEFGRPPAASQTADFTGKLVTWGLVSNRQEAEYVLIGLFLLALVLGFFIYWRSGGSTPPPAPVSAYASAPWNS